MQQPFDKGIFSTRLLLIAAVILFFVGLGASPIYILDEARNAQAAREMMEKNEWIVPTFNGELRPHKPPLHYYFMRLGYTVFGTNAVGARFFSAVMGLLTVWITWYFAKKYVNRGAAFWATAVLLLSTHFIFEFRLAVPDPYLIFFVTAGILCFYAFTKENKIGWLLLSATGFALSTLAKGPVAIALPGVAILSWLLLQKKMKLLLSWKMIVALTLFLVIALPWYIAVDRLTDGQFTREFFGAHNMDRFNAPMEGHGGSFILVPLFVAVGLLPLSLLSGQVIRQWRRLGHRDLMILSGLTAVVFILFFSFSATKLPNYPMPAYPFVAILTGYAIQKVIADRKTLPLYFFRILLVITMLLPVAAYIALNGDPATKDFRWWSFVLLIPPLAVGTALVIRRDRPKTAVQALAIGYLVFNFVGLCIAYPAIYNANPVTRSLPQLLPESDGIVAFRIYNPAFNFYVTKPIPVLQNKTEVDSVLRLHPATKIISREAELSALDGIPFRILAKERDLFETPTTIILTGVK